MEGNIMEKNYKLKDCPFCGNIPQIEKRKVEEMVDCRLLSYTSVGVWCNTCWFGLCNAVYSKDTTEDTNNEIERVLTENIQRWNTRNE